jgi:hypothetical protein
MEGDALLNYHKISLVFSVKNFSWRGRLITGWKMLATHVRIKLISFMKFFHERVIDRRRKIPIHSSQNEVNLFHEIFS